MRGGSRFGRGDRLGGTLGKYVFCGTKCLIGFCVRVFESVAKCAPLTYVSLFDPRPSLLSAKIGSPLPVTRREKKDKEIGEVGRSKIERGICAVRLPDVSNVSGTAAHKCSSVGKQELYILQRLTSQCKAPCGRQRFWDNCS